MIIYDELGCGQRFDAALLIVVVLWRCS